ncbi:MAG: TRAP transporter substrate-binding protein [Oscillospiraceae bacterium]|nr:TRAP transporter substrate-binding protein [Oscillospiraceae bacterium]
MKQFKKAFSLILVAAMILALLAGCGGGNSGATTTTPTTTTTTTPATTPDAGKDAPATDAPAAANDPKQTIMIAHWYAEDHPIHQSLLLLKKEAEELSGGSLQVDIYPNAQLGSEDTYIDSVKQGTVQMGITGTMIAKYLPVIRAQETPFLFSSWDEAKEGTNGKELLSYMTDGFEEASGMLLLGCAVNGFREFSSNKPMYKIEDFKGQRIRVPNVPNYIEMVEALGASPIAMALTDLFSALEQNSVDGQDNPYPTDYTQSFHEVQKYILESRHMFSSANIVINANFYNNTLTDAQRAALDTAVADAIDDNWTISEEADNEAKQNLIDAGVEVTVPDDAFRAQLVEAMQPVYEWYYENVEGSEEFIKAVWKAQGK